MPRTGKKSRRLMLVDGHSVAFRAYYAVPISIQDETGQPANALYGFMNTLFRVIGDHGPSHLAVTLDLGKPFREEMFPDYKAQRTMGPEDLEPQVRKLRDVLRAFDIPVFEVSGFEADDLLATLVRQARRQRIRVDILSGDMDILQLVGPTVRVVAPGKSFSKPILYDEARVRERYGIGPGELRDLKALTGDTSDGIPGVRGIGLKSASGLIARFGTLDDLYEKLDQVENTRMRNALLAGRDSAFLSRSLVELRDDAPVELDLEHCKLQGEMRARGAKALRALGFEGLSTRVPEY